MRLIGSFQTMTIQGTSGSATSSCSGARSRTGAVVLMLLMAPMVANPRGERKAGRDPPARVAASCCHSKGRQPALVSSTEGDTRAVEVLEQRDHGLASGAERGPCLRSGEGQSAGERPTQGGDGLLEHPSPEVEAKCDRSQNLLPG